MNAVMLGLPGAGKGTQAQRIAARLGAAWISTGDLLREAVREGTALGREARQYMDRGELVPDEVVLGMVEERLRASDAADGFVLDGFPRNTVQADHLDERLGELRRPLDHVVYLEVPEEEAVRRLGSRVVCEFCGQPHPGGSPDEICPCGGRLVRRSDDREAVVRDRLRVYKEQTRPLLDRYEVKGLLRRVDGTGSVEEVTERICERLEQRRGSPA